jgi:hypothetical protein
VTVVPAGGAATERVTVPVTAVPPVTELGENARDETLTGFNVRDADFDEPAKVAVRLSVSFDGTELEVTLKVAVFDPLATETVDG